MILRRVDEGSVRPRGYGLAFVDAVNYQIIMAPIPINVVIAAALWLWGKIVLAAPFGGPPAAWTAGFRAGFEDGRRVGREEGRVALLADIERRASALIGPRA